MTPRAWIWLLVLAGIVGMIVYAGMPAKEGGRCKSDRDCRSGLECRSVCVPIPTQPVNTIYPVQEQPPAVRRGSTCCRYCSTGKPCGDSCIPAGHKCSKPTGCAC